MTRLDELDLSLSLSREGADERLVAAQERLPALRLVLGGLIGDRDIGPPACVGTGSTRRAARADPSGRGHHTRPPTHRIGAATKPRGRS